MGGSTATRAKAMIRVAATAKPRDSRKNSHANARYDVTSSCVKSLVVGALGSVGTSVKVMEPPKVDTVMMVGRRVSSHTIVGGSLSRFDCFSRSWRIRSVVRPSAFGSSVVGTPAIIW